MESTCTIKEKDQDYSRIPPLKKNFNLTLDQLEPELKKYKTDIIYAYIVESIEWRDENKAEFVQRGSAPNWDGSVITLCTCKHLMRAYKTPEQWSAKPYWIAGFSSKTKMRTRTLVYLMKIEEAFESHLELWEKSKVLTPEVRQQKLANNHRLGDLFEPKKIRNADPFDPHSYTNPRSDHSHTKNNYWHQDIFREYYKSKKHPALLVGDPEQSYLWTTPKIYLKDDFSLGRNCRTISLETLFNHLEENRS